MNRYQIQSNAPWESVVGYSRAVRVGPHVSVAGTTGLNASGELIAPDDPYLQARQAIENIRTALVQLKADLHDVVRTRIYIVDREDWAAVGRAHAEAFGTTRPATTLVVVAALIDPLMRVEIEADAMVLS